MTPLTILAASHAPVAWLVAESSVVVDCDKAVFVDEQNATTEMQLAQPQNLRVGIGPEFGGRMWTLLSFGPVKHSQGGPLPDDAQITRGEIRMYKLGGGAEDLTIHTVEGDFDEDEVNWATRPPTSLQTYGFARTPAKNVWCTFSITDALIKSFTRTNTPVRIALRPTWTEVAREVVFQSDEHPTLAPKLVIYYSSPRSSVKPSVTSPEADGTEPSADDTTPCDLTYTISPSNPGDGQEITVTARATDDQEMYYLSIMRGSTVLARRWAERGETELEITFTEIARLPSMNYQIFADDVGPASPVGETISIPVVGSGTAPAVSVSMEWLDVERVIPDEYRLVAGDGQRVRITAEASDPDGIRDLHIFVNGVDQPFDYTGTPSALPRTVRETVEWTNDQPGSTSFSFYASARDRENEYSTAEGASYDIAGPEDIRLLWNETLATQNFGLEDIPAEISWERMCQIFGGEECWAVEGWNFKDPRAEAYWAFLVRDSAEGGQCFGFSTVAAEFYNGRIAASELDEVTGGAWQLTYCEDTYPGSGCTGAWVQARQAGQYGEEVVIPRFDRDMGPRSTLSMVERDLEADQPGVVGINEGEGGHALTPWMVRYMSDGTQRIYVYDSNRVEGIHNESLDMDDSSHCPYITIDENTYEYTMPSGTTYNDSIRYLTFYEACGDMEELVTDPPISGQSGYSYRTPYLTDHDIPNLADYIVAWITPDADAYFVDDDGNITGMYQGEIREDIAGSAAIRPFAESSFSEKEVYVLPTDEKLSIHITGKADGEYALGMTGASALYSLSGKNILEGAEDLVTLEPWSGSLGYRMRIEPGVADDNFAVKMAAAFAGEVVALGEEQIDREYTLEGIEATEESDFSTFVEEGGETFVVESYADEIRFDASTRSTESADYLDPDVDPGYIPASVEEGIILAEGRAYELTPETWASTQERGPLNALSRAAGGARPWLTVVAVAGAGSLAVALLIMSVLLGRRVRGRRMKA